MGSAADEDTVAMVPLQVEAPGRAVTVALEVEAPDRPADAGRKIVEACRGKRRHMPARGLGARLGGGRVAEEESHDAALPGA